MAKSQEVAMFGDKEASLPAYMQADSGLGNEHASGGALATPQVKLLQALSEEIRTVEGAKVGHLFDNVGKQLYDSMIVTNLYLQVSWTVWRDRKKGGGKVGDYETEAEANAVLNEQSTPADYNVQETHKHYLAQLDGETGEIIGGAVIYMKSSQLTPSRAWNTEIVKRNGPRFAGVWELGSRMERSRSNEEYANYTVTWKGWASAALYEQLKSLYHSVTGTSASEAA